MKKYMSLAALVVAASVGNASAATVINGSFEETPSMNGYYFDNMPVSGGSWGVWSSLPGWTTTSGAGIEVQSNRTLGGIDAHSGEYYVELDSHNNSSMEQMLDLDAGTYSLSFWYAPRTTNSATNGIKFSVGSLMDGVSGPSATFAHQSWTEVTRRFTVDSAGSYALSFAAAGTSDSYGGLIDSVSVSTVPVPASAALLLAGLAGFGALRRKKG